MAFKRKTRTLQFNAKRVSDTLNKRNPARYQRTSTLVVGGKKTRVAVHDAAKLKSDVERLRKKAAMKKGKALAREDREARKAAKTTPRTPASPLQKLAITGGLLAAGRYVARKASGLLNRTNKLGKYRF